MRGFKHGYGYVGLIVILLCGFLTLQLGVPEDAAAFQIKISSPANNSVVSGTVPISLLMKAGTSFANVYVDGTYLASTPSAISWLSTNAVNGAHTISAKAYDSANQVVGTASRLVRVKNGPAATPTPAPTGQLRITSPSNGATVSGTVSVAVQYAAPVNWLNFYVDGNWVASSPPSAMPWNSTGVANGQHAIAVNGYNSSNALVATAATNVNVQNGSGPTPTPAPTGSGTPKPTASPSATASRGGYYSLLPSGSALPSDSQCASGASGDNFEPVPQNAAENTYTPSASDLSAYVSKASGGEGGAPGSYLTRADGQFSGTTDAILKWASCKWGFDENVTRATAVNETHWRQTELGDIGNGTSIGILQIKSRDYPSSCEAVASSQNTSLVTDRTCYSYLSTAFAADYKLAQQRACFEGKVSYMIGESPAGYPSYPNGTPDQMMWGCVGWWYSGHWYDSGAVNYISQVKGYLSSQPWLSGGVGY